jgi:hypothetical protein
MAEETHFGFSRVPLQEKQGRVDEVFYKAAPRYDLMNDLMSGGLHQMWKDIFVSRVNLYAYFYEKGFGLLCPGGRLGYISSSTFFRTGSGEPLRHYLRTRAELENVVDFGDLQIFEGVTTYPAIVTMQRAPAFNENGQPGVLRFLNMKADMPEDLSRAFRAAAQTMPRARLGDGSWQIEDDPLAALRAKIKAGRKTLGEVYGPPLYGIKTGLNEAFVVSRERRDELVACDPRSAELLVPFGLQSAVGTAKGEARQAPAMRIEISPPSFPYASQS